MCYASPVMLRGRCSCAISIPRTSSSAPQIPLTPLFPLHPRKSPVTPLFPLLTQKQGGGGYPKEVKEPNEVQEAKQVDYNRAILTPAFTTTSINIVGAPTFLTPAPALSLFRILLNLKLTTGHPVKDAHPERAVRVEGVLPSLATNPNHSRTYAQVARKSNYSRTSAKTGGGVHVN